ncbi:hypothetical protein [Fimbriimonas ginsengisoli]|uniref:Uncharacterized protein n=1 Tax=Fimbriimonas ginsengisoli Gsoil 348 TaxID=661478 RepID=A0A068NL93_FIMGI|nr:hypothetical protein [Fimbriimonas ginsengisoli]AIE84182.1 hypothetical protein OP10G_0814 [Fimbriimonas ginsengisoli Gsoil 348]
MKAPIALAATLVIGTSLVAAPSPVQAQTTVRHHHHHHRLATIATGVGAYALAKHSHHGFFHKHPILTGAAAAWAMHHHLKHKHH